MPAVANAINKWTRRPNPGLFEDEAVGLCMALHRVRLITCPCIYDWGPCDIHYHLRHECRVDLNTSRVCRLPLTIHKLRKVEWYDLWWEFLTPREPRFLAELDAIDSARGAKVMPWHL